MAWVSGGAYLPSVSAPPAPSKLWHWAQSAVNSCWPSPRLAPEVLTSAGVGIAGPPARDAMYAATSRVSVGFSWAGLLPFSAPISLAGIRPVLTWKSTAAEQTPIRLGAIPVTPCASRPWQVAHVSWKICWPLRICARDALGVVEADDWPLPVMTAYIAPTRIRPSRTTA